MMERRTTDTKKTLTFIICRFLIRIVSRFPIDITAIWSMPLTRTNIYEIIHVQGYAGRSKSFNRIYNMWTVQNDIRMVV